MNIQKYIDFNDCFYGFNRWVLNNPNCGEMDGCQLQIPDVIIECDSIKADQIDLGKLGYNKAKWSSLLRNYIDLDKLRSFYTGLNEVSGNSYSFDFKTKDNGNGGCIKSLVLTRRGRKKSKWTELHIMWRTCQLETKFAGDLLMISRIINDASNCDIKHIVMHIPQAYMSAMYMSYLYEPAFFNMMGIPNMDHAFYKRLHSYDKWKDPNYRLCKRASVAKYQQFYRSWKLGHQLPSVTIKDCLLPKF